MTLEEFGTLPNLALSDKQQLPECSAIYFAVAQDQVLYVGLATNLRNRWRSHHRLPQIETIGKRYEVRLFWRTCAHSQLPMLERQYIDHYCPVLNQSKVPIRQFAPSAKTLSLSLKKLSDRLLCYGVCKASNHRLKTLFLGYLAAHSETRLATTTVRRTLQSINKNPNNLLKWTETTRRKDGAHWQTKCNGIEIRLMPRFGERITHNPSMYKLLSEKRFGTATSIPMLEYKAMRAAVKAMSLKERLALANGLQLGPQLFPLACGAQFHPIAGIEILCLRDAALQTLLTELPNLRAQYPAIEAVDCDPVPLLSF